MTGDKPDSRIDPAGGEADITASELLTPIDAIVKIEIAKDRMSAQVTLEEPQNGGKSLTINELRDALTEKGVVAGVDEIALRQLAFRPSYSIPIAIAKGKEAIPGEAAFITYHIRLEKDIRPHERSDGSVDYKDLGVVQLVHAGDVLCTKTAATPGTAGENVCGIPLPAKPGKDIPMPAGKNTVISEDRLQLLAAIDGQVDMVNNRLQVLNVFTVTGDVGNATGNISFLGNVNVTGSVRTGFSIQATGNVVVDGSVDDATIVAGGNITIKQGINGSSKGILQCGGYLKTKYIQSGTVKCAGDIETSSILHSNVTCGGDVRVSGKGIVVGGRVTARSSIICVSAGSRGSPVPTVLEVGNDPEVLARSREIPKEKEATKKNLGALGNTVSLLQQLHDAGRLNPDKTTQFIQAKKMIESLEQKLLQLEDEMERVQEDLVSFGYGTINISQIAYPFVRIVIGSEQMLLESNYDHCSFIRNEQGIQIVPLRSS